MIFRPLIVCVRPSSRFLIKINWCRNLEIEMRFNSYPFLYRITIFSWTEVANFCIWAFVLRASLLLVSFCLTVFYIVYKISVLIKIWMIYSLLSMFSLFQSENQKWRKKSKRKDTYFGVKQNRRLKCCDTMKEGRKVKLFIGAYTLVSWRKT